MAINDIESESSYRLFKCRSGVCRASKIRPTDEQPLPEYLSAYYPVRDLGAIFEPLIAMISATVTTRYTLYHEKERMNSNTKPMGYTFNSGSLGLMLDPATKITRWCLNTIIDLDLVQDLPLGAIKSHKNRQREVT
ncbi:uncharacterized protein EAF02_004611 [Botrytis sinoallii]|uniref:uncharacterized protein n=1 Tax=Botrytis sinoallii TaxID=1463999 RepID=UPI0018FF12AC|nr:uncharacterized protein EAF02_004611 [Botrytis sinoallii]KAF7884275.1 hypothetical protein EAF02_004611 [Botrytis sinoallii]